MHGLDCCSLHMKANASTLKLSVHTGLLDFWYNFLSTQVSLISGITLALKFTDSKLQGMEEQGNPES